MRSGRVGAKVLREARSHFERDGVEIKALRRCDPEGRDGTKLPASFKVYLPTLNGRFGMVFRFVRDANGFALRYLALAFDIILEAPTHRPSMRSQIVASTVGPRRR